jgi:hypothetical protein
MVLLSLLPFPAEVPVVLVPPPVALPLAVLLRPRRPRRRRRLRRRRSQTRTWASVSSTKRVRFYLHSGKSTRLLE